MARKIKHIAIIPARAGSKSIKNKNLLRLGNKTLVHRTVDLARKASFFDQIILTSDIELFLDYYSEKDVTLRPRPPYLCTDKALMIDVVLDAIETCIPEVNEDIWVWLLQPTSPLREVGDFLQIQKYLDFLDVKSIISVKDVQDIHPNRCYTRKNNSLYPLRHTNFENKQELIPVYIRNGCFYVTKAYDLLKDKTFYSHPCFGYEMPVERSINIDGPLDFEMAKLLYKGNNA